MIQYCEVFYKSNRSAFGFVLDQFLFEYLISIIVTWIKITKMIVLLVKKKRVMFHENY